MAKRKSKEEKKAARDKDTSDMMNKTGRYSKEFAKKKAKALEIYSKKK